MNSDDVVESPTKDTRKRKSTIPAVDTPAIATKGLNHSHQRHHLLTRSPFLFGSSVKASSLLM
jgi:hypothetical protein